MRKLFLILLLLSALPFFSFTLNTDSTLKKVCADLRKRELLFNCTSRYKPKDFIKTCSLIKNDSIKKIYNNYLIAESKKNKFRTASIVFVAVGGACVFGSVYYVFDNLLSDKTPNNVEPVIYVGLTGIAISFPLAVITTKHNIKKKRILYKHLPNAYNFYVNNL